MFVSLVQNPDLFNLKILTQVYRILDKNGVFLAKFEEVSKEKFEKLLKILRAIGFENKNPTSGHIQNEIIFEKVSIQGQSVKLSN